VSFSAKTPIEPKKLANISGYDTSSNQEAIPVTFFAGVAKIPLTWITPFYNLTSKTVEQEGKKGAGGANSQKNWYADIAGVACVCPDDAPVDAVLYVLVNDEVAFTGPLSRTGPAHYAALTLETYCQSARVYWGTKDQPIDTLILTRRAAPPTGDPAFLPRNSTTWPRLNAAGDPVIGGDPIPGVSNPRSGHYDLHPAYRNQCYFVFKQFFLGSSPNMPNVSVILARGSKFFGGARFEATEAGVNPMGPLYEILTDDLFGAGLLEISMTQSTFEDTATALTASGIFIAPVLRSATSLRGLIADYIKYYDGYFRRRGSFLEAGHFDHGDIDQSGLLELGSDDLTDEPSIQPGTLDDTKNHFDVIFTNREKWYGDDTESYKDLANFNRVGDKRLERIQAPFVIDPALAQRLATEWGRMKAAIGGGSGSAAFLRENVAALLVGDRFKLNSASFGLTMLMRVLGVELPADKDNTTKLSFSVEQADWKHLFTLPPAPKDPDFSINVEPIDEARIVILPSGLRDRFTPSLLEIAVLAVRPSSYVIGFRTHLSLDDVTYDVIAEQRSFAVRGRVKTEAYIAGTDNLDTTVGMVVELYGEDLETVAALSDAQRDNYTGLWFAGNEIGSWGDVAALGAGLFRIFGRRAIYDTIKALHAIDEDVWFIFAKNLVPIENANFTNGSTRYFKLQPFTATEAVEVGDIDPIAFEFPALPPDLLAPFALKVSRLYRDDSIIPHEAHVVFTWDYALEQDVVSFDVSWRAGGITGLIGDWDQVNVGATNVIIYDPVGVATVKRQSLDLMVGPSNLNYQIRVRAIDSAGVPSDWSGSLSRRAVASTTPDPNKFLHFTSKAELQAYSIANLNEDDIVFVTINNATQYRQLQAGAPAATSDWSVLDQPAMRWRKTGGT
jgi:hypothetical protein